MTMNFKSLREVLNCAQIGLVAIFKNGTLLARSWQSILSESGYDGIR